MEINLDQKQFKAISNSVNGSVDDSTTFNYYQSGEMLWATYQGGQILKGHLLGTIKDHKLNFVYHHLEKDLAVRTGKCTSIVSLNKAGKITLAESWQWTNGDLSKGTSTLIEWTP